MEKVKLTQEQADAIERGIKIYGKSRIMNDHALDGWVGNLNDLNGLTKDEIARALYVGYEVEPEFKVGDWVYVESPKEGLPNVYKIMNAEKYSVNLDRLYGNHKKSDIRQATPQEIATEKQRRWWEKHDREVGELRETDVVFYDDNSWGGIYIVYSDVFIASDKNLSVKLYNRHRKEITVAVSRLRVICFA